jgi:hypothetical protein
MAETFSALRWMRAYRAEWLRPAFERYYETLETGQTVDGIVAKWQAHGS